MHEPRPAASLNSGLLARRGDARPAMRRQSLSVGHAASLTQDDLGWNDLGDHHFAMSVPLQAPVEERSPVVSQIEQIAERMAQPKPVKVALTPIKASVVKAETPAKPASQKPSSGKSRSNKAPSSKSSGQLVAASIGRKAAFTLRLEPDRHLRLRLLSAVSHRSAQQLLIEALDALLAKHDDVEDLAGQVKAASKKTKVKAGSTSS